MFEMRSTSGCIGDDGVVMGGRKLVQIPPGQSSCGFQFTVMGMKGSAAMLIWRRVNFASILRQHLGGVPVDIAEDQVLGASGQQRDLETTNPCWGQHGRDQIRGEGGLNQGGH